MRYINLIDGEFQMVKLLDFLLAFFLGEFGIYRFYKGYILTGLLWLITGGVFGIGWLVDWVWVLLGKKLEYPK